MIYRLKKLLLRRAKIDYNINNTDIIQLSTTKQGALKFNN